MKTKDGNIGKKIGNFTFIKNLALNSASNALFYVATNKEKSSFIAKMIPISNVDQSTSKKLLEETQIAQIIIHAPHPNIVNAVDILRTKQNLYVFYEYCELGTLANYLNSNNELLPENFALMLLDDICKGFIELYKNKIMHRNINTNNIFLTRDIATQRIVAKLTIFEECKLSGSDLNDVKFDDSIYTSMFSSPEQLDAKPYNYQAGIYSIGMVLYVLLFKCFPMNMKTKEGLKQLLMKGGSIVDITRRTLNSSTHEFLVSSLQYDPNSRMTVEGLSKEELLLNSNHWMKTSTECKIMEVKSTFTDNNKN